MSSNLNPYTTYTHERPVTSFFVLAFLLSYVAGVGIAVLLQFLLPPAWRQHADIAAKFGPSAAGLIMIGKLAGRAGLRQMIRALLSFRVSLGWYLFAVAVPFALVLLSIGVVEARGGQLQQDNWNGATWLAALWLIPMKSILGGGLGEELGWRGFALPRLQTRMNALRAGLLVWVVWSAWHFPAFAMAADRTGEMPVWMFVLFVLAASIILTWIYNATRGNLLIPVLFHGCANASESLFEALVPLADRVDALGWMTLFYGVVALLILSLNLKRFLFFDPFQERAWGRSEV